MTEEPPSPLLINTQRLESLLGAASGRFQVDVLPTCESTNSLLLERSAAGAPSGAVLVADRQTAGRGSRGRAWEAAPEASLTFSLLWHFSGGVERLSGLSLAVGVAVVEALSQCGVPDVQLKWPNDILWQGRKLVGILTEMSAEMDAINFVVLGIGINVSLQESDFPEELRNIGASVSMGAEREVSRVEVLQKLLERLEYWYQVVKQEGFEPVLEAWRRESVTLGQPVRVLAGEETYDGVAEELAEDGSLLVRTENGLRRVLAGDVSLRLQG